MIARSYPALRGAYPRSSRAYPGTLGSRKQPGDKQALPLTLGSRKQPGDNRALPSDIRVCRSHYPRFLVLPGASHVQYSSTVEQIPYRERTL